MAITPAQGADMLREAQYEALAAAARVVPRPMLIYPGADPVTGAPLGEPDVIDDGICGTAWVNIKPTKGRIARAVAAGEAGHLLVHRAFVGGGLDASVRLDGQSYERATAAAGAFADVIERWAACAGERVSVTVWAAYG